MNIIEIIEFIWLVVFVVLFVLLGWLKFVFSVFVYYVLLFLVVIGLFLLIWEMLGLCLDVVLFVFSWVIEDIWELILYLFYDNGGNDVGVVW